MADLKTSKDNFCCVYRSFRPTSKLYNKEKDTKDNDTTD